MRKASPARQLAAARAGVLRAHRAAPRARRLTGPARPSPRRTLADLNSPEYLPGTFREVGRTRVRAVVAAASCMPLPRGR